MLLIGLFMLFGDKLRLPKFGFSGNVKSEKLKGVWGSLLLGMLFAMAFCPTSGVLYFGMLIPMSAQATGGYLLPFVFAFATGLPVILVAWLLAYSMGAGSDIAIEAAPVTIISSDLMKIPAAIRLSRQTVATVRQNLFWAFIYNIIAIPIAAGVLYPAFGFLLSPMIGSAAMAMSSVSVVSNSLRLRYKK